MQLPAAQEANFEMETNFSALFSSVHITLDENVAANFPVSLLKCTVGEGEGLGSIYSSLGAKNNSGASAHRTNLPAR